MGDISWLSLLFAFLAALVAGAMNSIAGGGTLLTFPVLIALGLDEKTANITSTLGLWPGSLGGAWGYRKEVAQGGGKFWPFFVPSLLGGTVGAGLLLWTSNESFRLLVPWLILTATLLFILQGEWARRQAARANMEQPSIGGETVNPPLRWPIVVLVQFLVAVYGGYFGAGIGILMLAALGLLGLRDIHQMNGLKNIGGLCINGMALLFFLVANVAGATPTIEWRIAAVMALGAVVGGYGCTGIAKGIGPVRVRRIVILLGLLGAAWTAYRLWSRQ
jgi:uncharacterized protein